MKKLISILVCLVLVSTGLFAKTPAPKLQAATSQSCQPAPVALEEPNPSDEPILSVFAPDNGATNEIISVYPNPATSFIEVKLPDAQDKAELSLYDITGKLIKSTIEIPSGEKAVRVTRDNLPSGVYFLVVKISSGQQCRKIIFS